MGVATPLDREIGSGQSYRELTETMRDIERKINEIYEILSQRHKTHYTVQEVARMLGRTDHTIRRHISEGVIVAVRTPGSGVKGRLLVPRQELQRLVAHGRGGRIPAAMITG